jgi:hypothetical protein
MEVTCSSETSVEFQWITPRYIPEDRNLYKVILWSKHTTQQEEAPARRKNECVMGLHIEYLKRKTQAQQSPQNSFKTPDDDQ